MKLRRCCLTLILLKLLTLMVPFHYFLLKKNADFMAPKVSVVLSEIHNATSLSKRESPSLNPSEHQLLLSCLKFLSAFWLSILMHMLKLIIFSLQFGFHKGLGTCDALLTITDAVQKSLDTCCEVRMIGLEFSTTFDYIDYKALIFKFR